MKTLVSTLLWMLLSLAASSAQIADFVLDPKRPITIEVSDQHSTTILFPKPVSAIIGNDLTNGGDGNDSAAFQYSHPAESRIVALVARAPNRNAPLVALLEEQLYLINLRFSTTPQLAVKLTFPKQPKPITPKIPVVKRAIPVVPPLDFSPPNLLRLLKLTTSYRLPTSSIPSRPVQFPFRQGSLTTNVDRITHFREDGALGITGTIANHGFLRRAKLRPTEFLLQVGGQLYPLTMVDVPTTIPRRKSVRFAAILMGDGKQRISFANDKPIYLVIPPAP